MYLRAACDHDLANAGRVGLTLRGLHDRSDDGAGRLDLAVADLLSHVRLGRERLVDGLFQGRVVGHDLEAALLDDVVRRAFACEPGVDDLPGELVRQRAQLTSSITRATWAGVMGRSGSSTPRVLACCAR